MIKVKMYLNIDTYNNNYYYQEINQTTPINFQYLARQIRKHYE